MENLARVNVKISSELHKAIRIYGVGTGMTLGEVISRATERFLAEEAARSDLDPVVRQALEAAE